MAADLALKLIYADHFGPKNYSAFRNHVDISVGSWINDLARLIDKECYEDITCESNNKEKIIHVLLFLKKQDDIQKYKNFITIWKKHDRIRASLFALALRKKIRNQGLASDNEDYQCDCIPKEILSDYKIIPDSMTTTLESCLENLCLDDTVVRVKREGKLLRLPESYGIVINKTGWVLTCFNLVSNVASITVEKKDGHVIQMKLFDHDNRSSLAVLEPVEEKTQSNFFQIDEAFKHFNESFPCPTTYTILLKNSFQITKGMICRNFIEAHNKINLNINSSYSLEKIKLHGDMSDISSGGPIILGECKTIIGIINCDLYNKHITDTLFGIPIDTIHTYICSVEETLNCLQNAPSRIKNDKNLNDKNFDLKKILTIISKCEDYEKESLDEFCQYVTTILKSYDSDVEAFEIRRRTAPGCIIFEINFLIVLKCERDEYQTIFELSQAIHKKLADSSDSFLKFSYLYVFEHSRWFFEWYTALKENKSDMKDLIGDNRIIDELVSDQLLSTEEYEAIKKLTTNKRINKFVEIISKRYPADIDMIAATLQKKQFIGLANYLKMVKENAMSAADPTTSLVEKSLVVADSASDTQTFNEIAEGENKLSEKSENVIEDVKSFDSGYHTRSAATEEYSTETTSESTEDSTSTRTEIRRQNEDVEKNMSAVKEENRWLCDGPMKDMIALMETHRWLCDGPMKDMIALMETHSRQKEELMKNMIALMETDRWPYEERIKNLIALMETHRRQCEELMKDMIALMKTHRWSYDGPIKKMIALMETDRRQYEELKKNLIALMETYRPIDPMNFIDELFNSSYWSKQDKLGSGSFGVVWLYAFRNSSFKTAVKQVEVDPKDKYAKRAVDKLEQEINLYAKLADHDHIVKYYGSVMNETEHVFAICLEYMDRGSLYSLLHSTGPLDIGKTKLFTRYILEGIAYLHSNQIIHRNIKCQNILLNSNGNVKLADFGTSKELQTMSITHGAKTAGIGNIHWMAPEVYMVDEDDKPLPYSYPVDIWSLGCTVVEMLTLWPPWHNKVQAAVTSAVLQKKYPVYELPKDCGGAEEFLQKCFDYIPASRSSAANLLMTTFCN